MEEGRGGMGYVGGKDGNDVDAVFMHDVLKTYIIYNEYVWFVFQMQGWYTE